jgi:hypothetical protein
MGGYTHTHSFPRFSCPIMGVVMCKVVKARQESWDVDFLVRAMCNTIDSVLPSTSTNWKFRRTNR